MGGGEGGEVAIGGGIWVRLEICRSLRGGEEFEREMGIERWESRGGRFRGGDCVGGMDHDPLPLEYVSRFGEYNIYLTLCQWYLWSGSGQGCILRLWRTDGIAIFGFDGGQWV